MSNHGYRTDKPADTYNTHSLQTGIAPVGHAPLERQVTQKEKVEIWFIDPLLKLRDDDGFVCLLICFPLIEAIVRYELGVPEDVEFTFSDNSPALKWFAGFMTLPEAKAREAWDALRNGLMHRGMIKAATVYVLTGEKSERPAKFTEDVLHIYVWTLRDRVVDLLRKHHKRLWDDRGCPLPRITVTT
jgi:hypothetical protein